MIGGAVRCTFLAVCLSVVCAEVVYRWNKKEMLPMGQLSWRATSFAHTADKIFLTLIDLKKQTLGNGVVGVFHKDGTSSPNVMVFPFENFYKMKDPERGKISTPMCVRTDDCERLWLLDSAVQNISGTQIKSNPAIHIFNSQNRQLIRSYKIPESQWSSASFFVNFVVGTESTEHDCEKSHGFFADFNRFHLLTYDFLRNKSSLKSHPFFSPDPLIHIPDDILFNNGHQDLNGVYGLALAKPTSQADMNTLYFHPLAGTHEFRISTDVLKSEGKVNYNDVEVFKDKGVNAESSVSVFDPETETIYLAEVNTRKIGVVRVKDSKASYQRYDLKLTSGHITDLSIYHSMLWVLVDDESDITIHKVPTETVNKELQDVPKQGGKPEVRDKGMQQPDKSEAPSSSSSSSAGRMFPLLAFLSIFLPFFSFL